MSGKEGKRSKGRRNLYSQPKNSTNAVQSVGAGLSSGVFPSSVGSGGVPTSSPFQPFGADLTMNVCDVETEFGLKLKSSPEDAEKITELMDAPADIDIPAHAISRGPNPYLDVCIYCNAPHTDSQEEDDGLELLDLQLDGNTVISSLTNPQPLNSWEIWTCANCRKVAGNFQSFLDANLLQASCDLSFLHDKLACVDRMSCSKCEEERTSHEIETQELQENWVELRSIVKDLYSGEDESVLSDEQGNRLKYLVDKLCSRDPHQLFLRLESQVREIVMGIKTSLLVKLQDSGYNTPELALDFTSSLLTHYELLTQKAHLLAQYLRGLSEHLRRFNVTWELLNKHLFHSIAHNDPAISNSGPTILEQLRQGSVLNLKSKDDPYCVVRKHLLKFQEEMSVVVVVWRDCQQLIENYCQEEVKNTQKQVSNKARSFISQQRQLLKEHLMKEPLMDEALGNLMSGHKSSNERVLFHRCKRERCTCDECTITHMITCGIINSDKGEIPQPPNSFNFASDHTRNVMDITPPSMSSTTSSSGSVSPINIDDKLTTFYDCERALKEEFSDALLNCDIQEGKIPSFGDCNNDDIDENAGDDEDEDDEDEFPDSQDADCDEPHALQIPLIELRDGDAALSEAIQHQQQQLLLQQQLQQQHLSNEPSTEHSCAQCHQGMQCVFQPRIDPELSRQLDAELAKSGLLPGGAGDCRGDIVTNNIDDTGTDNQGGEDSSVNPNGCAACQCHACLKQSGHIISTSLPLQVPVSPPPAELHLYPHIHGPPQQHHQRYMFDLPSSLMPPIKLPVKLDFNDPGSMQDHMYHAYSDWDNTMQPRPGSLAAQHQHQHHQRLSALNSELLPPAPLATTAPLFCFDSLTLASHLATHTTHTSTTNTASAFKSVAGKHLASAILPTLNNMGNLTSEGSSVDPTKPLNFSAMAKIPQSCLNASSSAPPSLSTSLSYPPSVLSSVTSTSASGVPIGSKSNGLCHGPPCSRPATLGGNEVAASKWERGPPQNCKKFAVSNSTSGFLNKQNSAPPGGHQHQHGVWVVPFTESAQTTPPPLAPPQAALKNLLPGMGVGHHHREDVFKLLPPVPCSHSSSPTQRPAAASPGCPLSSSPGSLVNSVSVPSPGGPSVPLACTNPNNLPAMVNNIGVGTALPGSDPGWEVHHQDDNCDSVDDSCSEKSSSTSASNQKEGKYCDCCYCEFFGHNNTQVAKTSTNYAEMKDRLRKKLKKRNENKHKGPAPKNGIFMCGGIQREDLKDPLEKKGLEGLLSFINGTDETAQGKQRDNKELTAKAAKRARQKQRKLEEKARLENSKSPNGKKREPEPECTLRQLQLNPTLNLGSQPGRDPKGNAKPKSGTGGGNKDLQTEESLHSGDPANSLWKQEITRSSLIIESTRPTISLTHKDVGKYPHVSPQKLLPNNNNNGKETSQQMQQFIDVLQTLQNKQQEHQHQILKSAVPVHSASSQMASPVKANGAVNSAPHTKSVEVSKRSPVSSKQNQHSNQQQPQQQSLTKSVSRIVSVPHQSSGLSSNVTPDVCGNARGSSNQHPVSNGSAKGFAAEIKGQQRQSTMAQANSTTVSTITISTTSSSKSNGSGSPSAGSTSSTSQSPSCGTKTSEQGKPGGKAKKNKKKNKNGDLSGVDEIFMPKSESELDGDVDEFERELEEFKRFCFEPAEPKEKRKLAVNVNLKDIFKKKTGLV